MKKEIKEKTIKAWAVVNKLQNFGKGERLDCFTTEKEAEKHRLHYGNEQELKTVPCEIKLLICPKKKTKTRRGRI